MKRELTSAEIEKRLEVIHARPEENPSAEDLAAIAEAEAEDSSESKTLEEFIIEKEYSGKLSLRIPKILHKELADAAKTNGVSLNQYALYKLSR